MEDDLVLNLTVDDQLPAKTFVRKGGRWTDRVKAKRAAKRKARPGEIPPSHTVRVVDERDVEYPAPKRARKEPSTTIHHDRPIHNTRPSQIISSLFSYNPKVDVPTKSTSSKVLSLPSNAPLADSSTFSGLGLDPLISAHLSTKMNISKPTSIQRAVLATMLAGSSREAHSRDVFIQSQTGSGKTLSFLLPIVQDLLPLSIQSYIDRSIGTLAVIIAPTRELAKQIADVLETLLKLRLRPEDESANDPSSSTRLTRWLVSGLLIGGTTRTHEKARLRKGIPILVSTPGRLLDHLQKTSSFNVGKCRWLVLDEADRLMELGFEETITGIIKGLDGRRKLAMQASESGNSMEVGGWDWERRRRTVLCSATLSEGVQTLAGSVLIRPFMIKATEVDNKLDQASTTVDRVHGADNFTPPAQLAQKFVVVPLKLRLVALVALLRTLTGQPLGRRGTKIIVFLSCVDSVDFHWHLLGSSSMDGDEASESERDVDSDTKDEEQTGEAASDYTGKKIKVKSSLLPGASIFRLHGSLPTPIRLASLRGFSAVPSPSTEKSITPLSSILFCTSVASRGLDLPLVRAVVQYDLPTEGGATEYVHRVGRTARVGKGGQAWSIISPSETGWVKWVEGKMRGEEKGEHTETEQQNITLEAVAVESVLMSGFGGKGTEYENRATEVQLSFERWVLRHKMNTELARKAFLSHMRAYATHPSNEKHIFHIRHLHMGHLAKSFALRDAPTAAVQNPRVQRATGLARKIPVKSHRTGADRDKHKDRNSGVEKRMQDVVRTQGRLSRRDGVMMSTGTSDFQIATESTLNNIIKS